MTSRTPFTTDRTPRVVARVAALAALCVTLAAGCLSRSPFTARRHTTAAPGPTYALASSGDQLPPRETRSFHVNSRLLRTVLDECTYVAQLRGTVRALPPRGALGIDAPGTEFEPQLRFDAWMACPGQAAPTHTVQTLTSGRRWSAQELSAVIAERGALAAERNGQRCTVRPEYGVRSTVIVGYAAHATCAPAAHGGGPTSSSSSSSPSLAPATDRPAGGSELPSVPDIGADDGTSAPPPPGVSPSPPKHEPTAPGFRVFST